MENTPEEMPSEDLLPDSAPETLEPTKADTQEEKQQQKRDFSFQFAEWLAQSEKESSVEKKLRLTIDFMRTALSQGETPRFKDFWEARRLCLQLFKENLPVKARALFWEEYVELSSEARRLKQLLDEQSAFAVEQIELAILSLEGDLQHFALLLNNSSAIDFPHEGLLFKEKGELYLSIQKELQLLNTLAVRINSLRKEIIKTEMRIRVKNKLLERLSSCGDRVFPKRKELIKDISQTFLSDVDHFIQTHFENGEVKKLPLHILREEIKSLQAMAKMLTLNTQTFTTTRLRLSTCWDQVREQEKERKKEIHQKKQTQKENSALVLEKISAFAADCRGGLSAEECNTRSQEIADYMRSLELGRDEVKALREELTRARNIILDRENAKELERAQREKEEEKKKREEINALKEELETLVAEAQHFEIDALHTRREQLSMKFEQLNMSKIEKQLIERQFKQLKDAIAEKKEKALLALSEEDLKSLDALKDLLKERVERRSEIKNQLEQYRKAIGGSGLDFEKAMLYRELIESEKASLGKIDAAIEELQEKIEEIEG